MGKNYRIQYSSMDEFYSASGGRIQEWVTQLEEWLASYDHLVNLEAYQGKSAEGVRTYLQEVHGMLLCSIQQLLQLYYAKYSMYRVGYYDIDDSLYACLPEQAFTEIQTRMKNEVDFVEGESQAIGGKLSSISDIISLGNPSAFYVINIMDGVRQDLRDLDREITDYEAAQKRGIQGELQTLLTTLQATLQEYLTNGTNPSSYRSGDLTGNTHMLDLYQSMQRANAYVEENQEEIELAGTTMEAAFAQMYEDACEAREQEGLIKMLQGAVAVAAGTIAIVGTAGAATPIVVTAFVAGGSSIAYGLSKGTEGAQDLYYGKTKQLNMDSFNFIRDTVFLGNEGAYEVWGNTSTVVAGFCVPVSHAMNKVAGASNLVLAKTAAKTVAKEMIKGKTAEAGAGAMASWAAHEYKLNELQKTALEIGLEIGLEKGMDSISGRISGGNSFTDNMSFEEAKRYNAYWDSIADGTHNAFPGLSASDLAAWNLADQKVQVYEATQKIDGKQLCDLRIREWQRQTNFLNPSGKTPASQTVQNPKTFTTEEVEELVSDATKGQGQSKKVVLGKFNEGEATSYDKVAEAFDAQYYNLENWDELAQTYSDDEMWRINERFLERQIESGHEIYLSHSPDVKPDDTSFFAREIKTLRDAGYEFIKEGDLWHARR